MASYSQLPTEENPPFTNVEEFQKKTFKEIFDHSFNLPKKTFKK